MPTRLLSEWASRVSFDDLPPAVVEHTCLRIVDVLGLVLAGLGTPFGRAVRQAVLALNPGGPSRILGGGELGVPRPLLLQHRDEVAALEAAQVDILPILGQPAARRRATLVDPAEAAGIDLPADHHAIDDPHRGGCGAPVAHHDAPGSYLSASISSSISSRIVSPLSSGRRCYW